MLNTLNAKILHTAKTTSEWQSTQTVIPRGLLCVEFAAGGITRLKVGDGSSVYSTLPYTDGNVDLSGYYTKSETDTAISTAITAIGTAVTIKGTADLLTSLPISGNKQGDLYFVGNAEDPDGYAEYVWVNGKWECLGKITNVDLSGYSTITYVDGKITAVNGRIDAVDAAVSNQNTRITTLEENTVKYTDDIVINCSI